jgi:hypothetical protein
MRIQSSDVPQIANAFFVEYLSHQGLFETLKCFERESDKLKNEHSSSLTFSLSSNTKGINSNDRQNIKREILNYLERGQAKNFFNLWEKYIVAKWRVSDKEVIRLEFLIQLFFATYVIRNSSENKTEKRSIDDFKEYLERKGSLLVDFPDLLPFYALPYISMPSMHPSFSVIFKDEWKRNLVENISATMDRAFEQERNQPEIFDLINKVNSTVSK